MMYRWIANQEKDLWLADSGTLGKELKNSFYKKILTQYLLKIPVQKRVAFTKLSQVSFSLIHSHYQRVMEILKSIDYPTRS
ncbi:MAG TPA: hypothetical protein DCP31_39320 [Cyanobacteria bacterium UBA8543]|nr:hypothetical protein [Cyanobacteria bacterium UBA8543]